MANDIDMWNDLEDLEKYDEEQAELLNECYNAKFINNDSKQADYLKNLFQKEYGYWGGYY
jgi:hypothetical protein